MAKSPKPRAAPRPESGAKLRGRIAAIAPGSLAEEAGLTTGDRVVAVNETELRDQIDYRFETAESVVELTVEREDGRGYVEFTKEPDEPLGIEFADDAFDSTLICNNKCFFCFLKGLPKGLRKTLYIKDDDYRLSLLHGNFVTLTNLTEEDWERIAEQRMSPLNVSVHATDPALRRELLGNPRAPEIVPQLRRLGELGVEAHTQVVLCPGVNDGAALDRTVGDLLELANVQTIAVVPVGSSLEADVRVRHPGMRTHSVAEARTVLRQVRGWQRRALAERGGPTVFPADEFYLLAGARIPGAATYGDFPQWENGIGMVRSLLDDWAAVRRRLKRRRPGGPPALRHLTIACGTLIAPTLGAVAVEATALTGARIDVVPIRNTLFGPRINVSGLLPGGAFIDQLRERELGEQLLLPRASLDYFGQRFLDDQTPAQLSEALGRPVAFAYSASEIVEWITAPPDRRPPATRTVGSNGRAWTVAG